MRVVLEFLGVLRRELGLNSVEVSIEGLNNCNLRDLLIYLHKVYPKMSSAIGSDGTLNTSYIVFINGVDFMVVNGYDYVVKDGDKLTFIPISHGGSYVPDVKEVWSNLRGELGKVVLSIYEVSYDDALKLVRDLDKFQIEDCITQILPSTLIISDKQLLLASLLTFKAIDEGRNLSKKPYIEFLLRLFSNRQIFEVVNKLKEIKSSSYLLIRVCRGSKSSGLYLPTAFSEVNPSELVNRYNLEALGDVVNVYGIPEHIGLDFNKVHSLILTKISLFQYIS
ncbi:MAG: hypothetical protein NZ911_00715 [Sulfolobales archaeon]|nr:hypothetical protein [Sulfolobales archaeon]